LLNGVFVREQDAVISAHDRSFRLGDGLFETILVCNRKPFALFRHLERLRCGLKHYDIQLDTADLLPRWIQELIDRNAVEEGYVRIVISRGGEQAALMGYTPPLPPPPPLVLLTSISKSLPAFRRLRLWTILGGAVWGSPCKTTSALPYVQALQGAAKQGCDNALLTDAFYQVCETASGALAWIRGETLYLPAPTLPLIPSTLVAAVREQWKGEVIEGCYALETLETAEEVLMMNVGHLVASVASIAPQGWTFPATLHARRLYEQVRQHIQMTTSCE
jgi:branched-subunit amino acid aminotransferase/4-amino-4-deoxychorismate lyase